MELNDWETGSVSRRLAVEYSLNRKRQIDVLINLETRMAELKQRVEQEIKLHNQPLRLCNSHSMGHLCTCLLHYE